MRPLEQWVPETVAALHALPSVAEQELRALGRRCREEVRRRSKGELRDAVHLRESDDQVELTSTHPGAAALETGAVLHGRPWIAVPLGAAVGLPGPRADVDLFTLRARDGRLFLASRASGALQLRWRLMREVVLRAQPAFGPGVEDARAGWERRMLEHGARALVGGS